jgi:D-alanine--D-alanine ligase
MSSALFQLALICGGPSAERGISLNSARSLMDHLQSPYLKIIAIYVDRYKRFYQISPSQLYSNTPEDFDFKLHQTATALDLSKLKELLKTVDLVFPAIHGSFGEDGELQNLLEKWQIPFVSHSSACCRLMFPKHAANEKLLQWAFPVLPYCVLSENTLEANPRLVEQFFQEQKIQKAIVKPSNGGSSIGVYLAQSPEEALHYASEIFEKKLDQTVLLEKFCEGREFTIVVFQNLQGQPVALLPTEIELIDTSQLFDYRKKYLPTAQSIYHTPARFSDLIVETIRKQAEKLFTHFEMQDFVRLDGWVTSDGTIYFTDNNPLSGLEQNSFLFLQTAAIGMSHSQALHYVIKRACQRQKIIPPHSTANSLQSKKRVYVLFGGSNAERQVSLMSGTNVWLKLLQSTQYDPLPFFLDSTGKVWQLPYLYTLNHTVEEIYAQCTKPCKIDPMIASIQQSLAVEGEIELLTSSQTIEEFIEQAYQQHAFVFIALHGGIGEDGTLQTLLEDKQIPFNGSSASTSALCMDKYRTGQMIDALRSTDLSSLPKCTFSFLTYREATLMEWEQQWNIWCEQLKSNQLIIKPRCDGCSAGIVLLQSAKDLAHYAELQKKQAAFIPPSTFANQVEPIEMPAQFDGDYLLETYIEVDHLMIQKQVLDYKEKTGWLELTVGVLEENGQYHALNPSLTVASGAVLSIEEKFQGGTGINLTPPPEMILASQLINKIKKLIEKAAQALKIQNYARLDVFFNRLSQQMILIEANTLPALTPSTVIYHQALAETPALPPLAFLEQIITSKLNSYPLTFRDLNSIALPQAIQLTF